MKHLKSPIFFGDFFMVSSLFNNGATVVVKINAASSCNNISNQMFYLHSRWQ